MFLRNFLNQASTANSKHLVLTQPKTFNQTRLFSVKHLTPSIAFFSNDNVNLLQTGTQSLEQYKSKGRSLAILLPWIHANMRAVEKYVKFYLSLDFDVITYRISVPQFFVPFSVEHNFKDYLIPILLASKHPSKLVHGFSIGVYSYGRILKNLELTKDSRKEAFIKSVQAQIWDSPGSPDTVAAGIIHALFSSRPKSLSKHALQKMADTYLKSFGINRYHAEAMNCFIERPLNVPALFLISEIDPLANRNVIKEYTSSWKQLGIPCEEKVWSDSAHVSHFVKYPDEYMDIVKNFLSKNGLDVSRSKHVIDNSFESQKASVNVVSAE